MRGLARAVKLVKLVYWLLGLGEEAIDVQDGRHGSHLGFPIGTILAIFDLQVTLMLPPKFGVNWLFD